LSGLNKNGKKNFLEESPISFGVISGKIKRGAKE
jgi:hypothetical protein